jgi:hypothetical protein
MTVVAGEVRSPPAGKAGMTDDEMAWLAGGSSAPAPPPASRARIFTPPPPDAPPPAETGEAWPGTTTDEEVAAAALSAAAEAPTRRRSRLDEGPDELPPLPGHDGPVTEPGAAETPEVQRGAAEPGWAGEQRGTDASPGGETSQGAASGPEAPASRGRGPVRIALAAALVAAAGAVVAWQVGWLSAPSQPSPPPVQPPAASAEPPPAPEPAPPAEPLPAPEAAPPPEAAPAGPAAEQAAAEAPPAPAPGPGKRPPRADADRDRRNLRIARKDRRLLDLLEKKGDAEPVSGVERSTLDTGLAAPDQAAVERTVAENRPAFAACVTRALKVDPGLRVEELKATLMLTVRPNGTVARAWIAEADLDAQPLGRCLAGVARRVVFPAFQGAALDVSAPLKLGAIR